MSFLKKLLKSPVRRKRRNNNKPGVSEGRDPSADPVPSPRSSPSPMPKMATIAESAVSTSTTHNTTTVGVRSPSSRHVAQVLPGLLLGSQEISQDLQLLQRYKVTHILNMTQEVDASFPKLFTYKQIKIPDMPSTQIAQYFEECFEFIEDARSNQGCVLVHCYYGASRSASIVMAYLIKTERMRYREALEYLQILRPGVHPNEGFEKQLRVYETEVQ